MLEILPVFARKPLWGYRLAVAGMLGVTFLSFFVWQHHLFVSGINSTLRPFYMLTTELISIPTGFIFLNAMGTLWQGRIRFTVPMLFALAFFFNFLIGGLSGVFLSDVPSDVTTHGSFFVMAHFHYTIMGGLVFAFFAATYYWLPKMTGVTFNERLARIHFWGSFVFFNLTFFPLFAAGFLDMPRRVSTYAPSLQTLNDFVSVSAFALGASMLVFVANLIYSLVFARNPVAENPWQSRGLEWQVPTPVPVHNFDRIPVITGNPYDYGVEGAPPVAQLNPAPTHLPGMSSTPATVPVPSGRGARGRGAGAEGRLVPARGCRRLLLRRLPVRVPLPARAQQQRALGRRQARPSRAPGADGGIVILVCVLATAVLARLALVELRGRARGAWLAASGGALALGLVAVGVQCWQYASLGFGPGDGGYASVYLGWTGFFTIFALGALLWLEAIVASSLRSDLDRGVRLEADVASFSLVWTMLAPRRDHCLRAPLRGAVMNDVSAGAVLTLVIPLALLLVVLAWWAIVVRRAR